MYKLIKSIIKRRTKKIPAILKGKGLSGFLKRQKTFQLEKRK